MIEYRTASNFFKLDYIYNLYIDYIYNFKIDLFITDESIKHFDENKNSDLKVTIKDDDKKTKMENLITDYFTEEERIECRNIREKYSIKDFYTINHYKINKIFIYKKGTRKSSLHKDYFIFKDIIEKLYRKQCTLFSIQLALSIYTIFKPRKIIDMSAGWGNRLIASIMYKNADYLGVDPNSKLSEKYKKIIDTFKDEENHYSYIVKTDAFENFPLSGKFDLCFSSPPYFIAEAYTKDIKQSFNKYKTVEDWLKYFIYVSIDKLWDHLIIGGFLIFNINDVVIKYGTSPVRYTNKIINYIKSKNGSTFLGTLKFSSNDYIHPIIIFQKLPSIESYVLNRPFIVENLNRKGKKYNLIRDDILIGGSEQRIIENMLKRIRQHNVFYLVDREDEFNQISLSYGCYLKNKVAHLIVNYSSCKKTNVLSYVAKIFGAIIHYIGDIPNKNIVDLYKSYEDSILLSEGFRDETNIEENYKYFESLKDIIGDPKTIWVVVNSSRILEILYGFFNQTFFNVVITRPIDIVSIGRVNMKIYDFEEYYKFKSMKLINSNSNILNMIVDKVKNDDYIFINDCISFN